MSTTLIPELRLFLDDGRDKFHHNLYIPMLDAPHHLAQVCVCGLARTCHYSTTKKGSDKLGLGPRGKNNYYKGKRCQHFTWNPGYHECNTIRLAKQQRSGNIITEGRTEIQYVKLDNLVHMIARKFHHKGLFLIFECLEETEEPTQLIKWEDLDNHQVCTKCLGMFQIKNSERKSLEDFF